jgi:hypothetical protein
MTRLPLLLAILAAFLLLSSCSRPSILSPAAAPPPSIEHPACIDVALPLDGKQQAWQTSDQDLFIMTGTGNDPKEVVKLRVCYKGRQ